MAYAGSPGMNRRNSSRYEEYPSRPREISDDYGRSRSGYGKSDRSRESNGFDREEHSRGGGERRYPFPDRAAPGPTRYAGGMRGGRGGGSSTGIPPKPSRILGVFGLSLRTEEHHLYDVMSAYGPVEDIQIVYDSLTGRSRGFAFVYFQDVEDARAARSACAPGLELHDRVVRVDYSMTAAPHQATPGVYMGKDKRRNLPDRDRRSGYSDRRGTRPTATFRRSRSRTRSPPRRRTHESPYNRRSRVVSSSRSRSPPPVYSPGQRRRARVSPTERSVGRESANRYREPSKDEWSDRSATPR